MKKHLIFKLLAIHLVVILFVVVLLWISIDTLAAGYFVTLMEKYNISPEPAHDMFVSAVHRYLIWASLAAAFISVVLSFLMMHRVLKPLTRMTEKTREIAAGNFTVRVSAHTNDEIGQLARAFNRMAESLDEIENLRRNLMIDVAHELRTPLTNMRGYLEAIMDNVLPPSNETLNLLQSETLRLAKLVEDVLQLARADVSHGNIQRDSIDIRNLALKSIESFHHAMTQKPIAIKLHAAPGPIVVSADEKKISRVFRNLTDNAVRYTPQHNNVDIHIQTNPEMIRVSYTNSCGDLIPTDLPFLFERFYRGEKSRSRQHGGAGIGLAIVKELIEAHNGKVGAELVDDKISIWFELPKASTD